MNYEFIGTVTEVFPIKTVGQRGFQKREIRIREDREGLKYPNIVAFMLKGDKCALADSLAPNDKVKIHFALAGRIWAPEGQETTRCFVDLDCWKIDLLQKAGAPVSVPGVAVPGNDDVTYTSEEDVPF